MGARPDSYQRRIKPCTICFERCEKERLRWVTLKWERNAEKMFQAFLSRLRSFNSADQVTILSSGDMAGERYIQLSRLISNREVCFPIEMLMNFDKIDSHLR